MAKDVQSKKRKGMSNYIPTRDFFLLGNYADIDTASVPESEVEKAKKIKKVAAETTEAPAKKRKGNYLTPSKF